MKPIEQLNNVERAMLLHELFPEEIPAFLKFVKGMCATLKEQEAADREDWQNGLFTFDFWMQLVNQAKTILLKYGNQLEKSSKLFADQLFDGYLAMYLAHCLSIYASQQVLANDKFSKMIDILFNS